MELADRGDQLDFGALIDGAEDVVEEQEGGFAVEGAGEGGALALAAGEGDAALADDGVEAFGEGSQQVHLKQGASRAFVVMASAADQEAAVKGLDRTTYQGKMLRCAKSAKSVF